MKKQEEKVELYKKRLREACGENEYNTVKEEVGENINYYSRYVTQF